ncbi:MAG: GrpB family protein [Acidobacteria bacterium]|nr:GrpB family protein [Acidobacteriota bacterium]
MVIGLQKGQVILVHYNSEWERLFAEEKDRLQATIGDYVIDIQHVGSTSIPGIVAKPIIDIGIAVNNYEEASICIGPMERLGYEYRGENGIPRRHYFVKGSPRTHHIHVVEMASHDWQTLVLFRDYLLAYPEIAQKYAVLKLRLADEFRNDREAYQQGKGEFIQNVIELAKMQI